MRNCDISLIFQKIVQTKNTFVPPNYLHIIICRIPRVGFVPSAIKGRTLLFSPSPPDNFNPGVIRFSFIEIPLSSCKQHVLFQISKNQQKIMIIVNYPLPGLSSVCMQVGVLCLNNCLFSVSYQIFNMKHFVYITLKEFPSTRVNYPGDVNPVRGPCLQTPVVV